MDASASQDALPLDLSVSPRDLASWEREKARLIEDAKTIQSKIERLDRRINAFREAFQLLDVDDDQEVVRVRHRSRPAAREGEVTYISALTELIGEKGKLAPYQAKELLSEGPLGEKIAASEKGFYHAIDRLVARGIIMRHNGWLFSPPALSDYQLMVAMGQVVDERPPAHSRSPLNDAILAFIGVNPGTESKQLMAHTKGNGELAGLMTPNSAYNALARLIRTGKIVRQGVKLYLPGQAPMNPAREENVENSAELSGES